MDASALNALRLLAACAAATFCGLVAAVPAAAEPVEPGPTGPTADASNVIPAAGVLEGMWREYVPRNAAPPAQMGAVDRFFAEFVPSATQIGDFFAFLQQFRAPATITSSGAW
ncbi:hypothetical protein QGN32_01290 [Mycolicibacterium sp. ND9-15]|uniref:hypothetical protein n=1 Tax=Mycolicibacterium sp. ND9-15 TaxID=3042320 RepID=UPI002DDB1461|nr:hypothetical protein [Mycolicibacterium sp. ND9-15]WSE56602.1 hypothetical protein QGN32_01290 [Mycolicibacterium sp. ND9-15]